MVRIKRGKSWEDLNPTSGRPANFTRNNGARMTEDEIKAIAVGSPASFVKHDVDAPRKSGRPHRETHDPTEIWQAVERLGTQVAAAQELGIKQGSIQSGLKRYMTAYGIAGPLPGLLTPEQVRANAQARAAAIVGQKAAAVSAKADEPKSPEPKTISLPIEIDPDFEQALEDFDREILRNENGARDELVTAGVLVPVGDDSDAPVVDDAEIPTLPLPRGPGFFGPRNGSAIDLTDAQAKLVLGAVNASFVIERLRASGFDVVVRLRREAAA